MSILQPYIDRKTVSMYPTVPRNIPFRQAGLYKKLFTEVYAADESKWITMIDLDEYLYSPQEIDVRKILRQHEDLSVVGLNWVMFGSNGYKSQPKSIVQAFTKRADYNASLAAPRQNSTRHQIQRESSQRSCGRKQTPVKPCRC